MTVLRTVRNRFPAPGDASKVTGSNLIAPRRAAQPTCPIEPAPLEDLVDVYSVGPCHTRHRGPFGESLFNDPALLRDRPPLLVGSNRREVSGQGGLRPVLWKCPSSLHVDTIHRIHYRRMFSNCCSVQTAEIAEDRTLTISDLVPSG